MEFTIFGGTSTSMDEKINFNNAMDHEYNTIVISSHLHSPHPPLYVAKVPRDLQL